MVLYETRELFDPLNNLATPRRRSSRRPTGGGGSKRRPEHPARDGARVTIALDDVFGAEV